MPRKRSMLYKYRINGSHLFRLVERSPGEERQAPRPAAEPGSKESKEERGIVIPLARAVDAVV